jgi:uncharacterized protein
MSALESLIRVQDFDISISQLQHRKQTLQEKGQLDSVMAQLSAIGEQEAGLRAQRQVLLDRQAELEANVSGLTARRDVVEKRTLADRSLAPRDLQAMVSEVHHLTNRRAELEEVELELMEEQEPIDAELKQLVEERAQLQSAADGLRHAVAAAESVVDAELEAQVAARALEASQLPTDLADRYETIRAHLGGVGAARLTGNRCEGCHLELPSVEVDRIRHLPVDELVTCDQCGRILVRNG